MKKQDLRALVDALLTGLLTIAFVVLKLTGVIGWSWVWVVSPLWLPLVLSGLVAVGILVYYWFKRSRG